MPDTTSPPTSVDEFGQRIAAKFAGMLPDEHLHLLQNQAAQSAATVTDPPASCPAQAGEAIIVRDEATLDGVAERIRVEQHVAIDLETSSLDQLTGHIVGVGLAWGDASCYIPVGHRDPDTQQLLPDQLPLATVLERLQLDAKPLIAANAKFELHWLRHHGHINPRFKWDVIIAARLREPHRPASLKEVACRELDVPDWALSKSEMARIETLPVDRVAAYCARDCRYTLQLYQRQHAGEHNEFLLHEVELPLIPIVADMEETGYAIDLAFFEQLGTDSRQQLDQLNSQIQEHAGEDFNSRSPAQVAKLLFEKLKLPSSEVTASGTPSTSDAVLSKLVDQHPVVPLILRHRELSKLLGTYGKIAEQAGPDRRLKVSFNPLAAKTGRFSSSSIIQTVPAQVRDGFVAAAGHQIVAADFRQQELNLLAQISGDENMLAAVRDGVDLHGVAAARVFGLDCDPAEVAEKYPEQRKQVKAIQFGILYGKTAWGLAKALGISQKEAEKLQADYFRGFPKVKDLIARTHKHVAGHGWVEDIFGRRRYFPEATAKLPRKRADQFSDREREVVRGIMKAKRAAQNFVIQGAAATVTKLAMIRCHRHTQQNAAGIRMLLQLHDELQFEAPDAAVAGFTNALPELMCDLGLERFGLHLPMQVEVKVGPSWGQLKAWQDAA